MTVTRPVEDRFWEKVDTNGPVPERRPDLGPCWIWTANRRGLYGRFSVTETYQPCAHRYSWELANGRTIAEGLTIDHLCGVPHCVNPDHLEEVTQRENNMRSVRCGTETHCLHGHEFTPGNTYITPEGGRQCRVCKNEALRRHRALRGRKR